MAFQNKQETICWNCEWAGGKDGKCPWASKFEPVEGWEATLTTVRAAKFSRHTVINSYIVHQCPMFEMLAELKRREAQKKENAPLKRQRYTTNDFEKIRRLHDQGKTYIEIAGMLGIGEKSIYRVMRRERLKAAERGEE